MYRFGADTTYLGTLTLRQGRDVSDVSASWTHTHRQVLSSTTGHQKQCLRNVVGALPRGSTYMAVSRNCVPKTISISDLGLDALG